MRRFAGSFLLAVIAVAAVAQAAAQSRGNALMSEANQLFRSKLYSAALQRYREAEGAGVSSALLDYNIGVTCYRLQRYDDAVTYLEKAYGDDSLAALSAYNLGLSERAAGRADEAGHWFDVAATRARGTPLETLARQSLEHAQSGSVSAQSIEPRRVGPQVPPLGELNIVVRTGMGKDDNPNRSPSEPYVDLASPGTPTVVPEPVPSNFTPVQATVQYALHNESGDTDLIIGYDFDGDYYAQEFANDEKSQRFRVGANVLLGDNGTRRRVIDSMLYVVKHDQRNYDPDNGVDRTLGDAEIWQQYSYVAAGLQGKIEQTLGKWQWAFDALAEHRDYDSVPLVADYDTDLYLFKLRGGYAINDATSVRAVVHTYRRQATERQSRDSDGTLLSTYPPLDYSYQGLELGVTRRVLSFVSLDFSYLRLDRIDHFEDYADYTQDIIGLRAVLRPGRRWTVSAGATLRDYNYPNAFAFNDPAAGPKTLHDVVMDLSADVAVTKSLSLSFDLASTDVTSTDPRAAYARQRSWLGVVWRY